MLKLQKRAGRVMTSSKLEERSSEIFQMLEWTKVQSKLQKRELVVTFKALRGMTPEYLTQMFPVFDDQNYKLRHNYQKLFLSKPKTDFLKRSSSYREPNFNGKNLNCKNTRNLHQFLYDINRWLVCLNWRLFRLYTHVYENSAWYS